MKKCISAVTAWLLSLCIIVCPALTAMAAETVETSGEDSGEGTVSESQGDMSIEGTNGFGNLLGDELADKEAEQQKNMGNNIFSVEVKDGKATVNYETNRDATLVVGIYDEAGVQMITSVNALLSTEEKTVSVDLDATKIPDYFYIRAFMVETDTFTPICSAYESPNYTREMQEFLAKTTDDFEEEKVLNLDEDKTNNFAVYNEDVKMINTDNESNKLISADDDNLIYVISNIDNSVSSLNTGDIFSKKTGDNEVLIVKVSEINIENDTATIKGDPLSMEDVFDYVKIDGVIGAGQAEVVENSCVQGVTYNGIVEKQTTSSSSNTNSKICKTTSSSAGFIPPIDIDKTFSESLSYTFDSDLFDAKTKSENLSGKATIKGSVEFALSVKIKLYSSDNYHYLEFKAEYSLKDTFSISGTLQARIPLGEIVVSPALGLFVTFKPSIVFRSNAKIELSATLKGSSGIRVSNTEGIKDISTPLKLETEAKIEGTIFIGLSLEPSVKLVDERIASAKLTAEAGIEAKATLSTKQENDVMHTCNTCYDGTLTFKMTVEASAKFANNDKLSWKLTPVSINEKLGNFYYSVDNNEWGFSSCPHKKYKFTIVVLDKADNKPIENADIEIEGTHYATNVNGELVVYLDGNNHDVTYFKDGYNLLVRTVYVKGDAKKITIFLEKSNSSGGNSGSTPGTSGGDDAGYGNYFANREVSIKDVQAYASRTAVITKNNALYMFGHNDYGQCGIATNLMTSVLTPQKIMNNVKDIKLGYEHTVALTTNGDVFTWGINNSGQLGDGTNEDSSVPIKIMSNVKAIAAGYNSTYAVTNNGDLYSWGSNYYYGQLGDGTTVNKSSPQKIMRNIAQIFANKYSVAAITTSGDLYTWGDNDCNQLGIGAAGLSGSYSAIPVKILSNVKTVQMMKEFDEECNMAAITNNGELFVWGTNICGTVGNGSTGAVKSPVKIMDHITSVSLSYYNTAAVTDSGELYMWGLGTYLGSEKNISQPQKYMDHIAAVNLAYCFISVITTSGELYTWGNNSYGELGNKGNTGYNSTYSTPQKILTNCAKIVSCDGDSTIAVTYDNGILDSYLYTWGKNYWGQLGDGTTADRNTPTRITLTNTKTTSSSAGYNPTNILHKTYEGLDPYGIYNFYVMKSRTDEEPLSAENLYYISQYTADENGMIDISYAPTENYETADRFLVAMDRLSIREADVEISDMIYNGQEQYADPIITVDDVQLTEGVDYELTGDYSAKDAGEYTITVNGIGKYDGTLTLDYNVIVEFLNLSDIDRDLILLGDEINIHASGVGGSGDYKYTYYFRQVSDPYWSVLDVDTTDTDTVFEPYKSGQYYARVDIRDSLGKVKSKAMYFEVKSRTLVNTSTVSTTKTYVGTPITAQASAEGGSGGYQYAFYYKNIYSNKWIALQKYSDNQTVNFRFDTDGMYDIYIKVKDSAGVIAKKYFGVTVENEVILPLKNKFSLSKSTVKLGEKATVKAKASGGKGQYEYSVLYRKSDGSKWTMVQDFAENDTITIEPAEQTVYEICTKVRDESGKIAKKYLTLKVISPVLVNTSKISSSSVKLGESVTLYGYGKGGTAPYTYALMYKKESDTSWTKIGTKYGTASSGSFTPKNEGTYDIMINVRDDEGTVQSKSFKLTVIEELLPLENTSTISAESITFGDSIKLTGSATGGKKAYKYAYYYKKSKNTTWTKIGTEFGTATTATFKPTAQLNYDFKVIVKDTKDNTVEKLFTVEVAPAKALGNISTISSENVSVGTKVTLTAKAEGGTSPYKYTFKFKKASSSTWQIIGTENGTATTGSFTPGKAVNYDAMVIVKDSTGATVSKTFTVTVK